MDKMAKPMTTKYVFDWCERCIFLQGCYYQHGEKCGPMFLEPACGNGPATEEAAGAPNGNSHLDAAAEISKAQK